MQLKLNNFTKLFNPLIILLSLFAISCSESYDNNEVSAPTVNYNDDPELAKKMKNYTNADWLFKNYFEEYGVPLELKSLMYSELKMVANGFALQYSKGEKVEESIELMNNYVNMMILNGEFKKVMLSIQNMHNEKSVKPKLSFESSVISTPKAQENKLPKDSLQTASLIESNRDDSIYIENQKRLVDEHNLPYKLKNNSHKYIIISKNMKNKKEKKSNQEWKNYHKEIKNLNWWAADIAFAPNGSKDGRSFDHVGLVDVDKKSGDKSIIDANLKDDDGRPNGVYRENDIQYWARNYDRVDAYYYTGLHNSDSHYKIRKYIVGFANSEIGKSYDIASSKKKSYSKSDTYYCSLLIWKAYIVAIGVDLDADGGLFVFPRDITKYNTRDMLRKFSSSKRI